MELTIDHVPYACTDLEETTTELERLGLAPEYGGVHDNGVTHMSVLGFDDRSYLEVIAEREDAGRESDHGFWPAHIRADAGPAAWCVRVSDVVGECQRVLVAGRPVHGPLYGSRERDDGTLVEWDRAEFGTASERLLLPFAIEDRTPLPHRVTPSPSVADGPLSGIGQVVIAVADLEERIETFRECYRFPRPVLADVPGFGKVASFPGQPVALATPAGEEWLASRLETFHDCPCSCLFATDDLDAAGEDHPLSEPLEWPDGRIATFESEVFGRRLGVVERTDLHHRDRR